MLKRKQTITRDDVAKRAGVSPATVSRVVTGTGRVGEQCRAHVQQIIVEMGYKPNHYASTLASRRAKIIGIIVPNLLGPFYGALVSGIEEIARNQNYKVLIANTDGEELKEQNAILSFRKHGCESIVLHSNRTCDETLLAWMRQNKALVLINRLLPDMQHRCVWLDNQFGAQTQVNYLINHQHTKIAFIGSDSGIHEATERYTSWLNTLKYAGIKQSRKLLVECSYNHQDATEALDILLSRDEAFTAIVTFNDVMAVAAINRLKQLGIKVPEQISVIGFDDLYFADFCRPKLTTIRYPVKEMAECAANLAIELIDNNDELNETNLTYKFNPSLIKRSSVTQNR